MILLYQSSTLLHFSYCVVILHLVIQFIIIVTFCYQIIVTPPSFSPYTFIHYSPVPRGYSIRSSQAPSKPSPPSSSSFRQSQQQHNGRKLRQKLACKITKRVKKRPSAKNTKKTSKTRIWPAEASRSRFWSRLLKKNSSPNWMMNWHRM